MLRKKVEEKSVIWRILSAPKYVIMNLKINNFKDNKLINNNKKYSPYFSGMHINLNVHVCTKINIFIFYKVGLGAIATHSAPGIQRNL